MQINSHTFSVWDSCAGVRCSFLPSINKLFIGNGSTLVAQKAKINMLLCSLMCDREDGAKKHLGIQAKDRLAKETIPLRKMIA